MPLKLYESQWETDSTPAEDSERLVCPDGRELFIHDALEELNVHRQALFDVLDYVVGGKWYDLCGYGMSQQRAKEIFALFYEAWRPDPFIPMDDRRHV